MRGSGINKIVSVLLVVSLSVGGVAIGAQRVAAYYQYNRALGEPLFELGATPFYAPWKLFLWQISAQDPQSRPFQEANRWALGGILLGILFGLAARSLGNKRLSRLTDNVFGDAGFASSAEVKTMGFLKRGRGVFLGMLSDGRYLRDDGPTHCAVIAPTRSGKGVGVIVPTLLTWRASCVTYDLKEENFQKTAGRRSEFSDILYFNPNSLNSVHFNPLLEIRPGIFEVRDAQNIANMIVEPDKPGVQDHWVRTGTSLLTAAILHVLYSAPKEEKNLAGVAALLSRPTQSLTDTLYEMLETNHIRDSEGVPLRPHPGIVAAARDVLNKSPDDRSSVVSTVMGYLAVYRDPLLANATRDSDFTINDLVNSSRPKSLYLVIPPGDIDRLRPVIRIMVNLICRRLTEVPITGSKNQAHRHQLLMMLDEFPALGRLEFFETALSYLAGYGIKTMIVAQSLSQLRQVYGERSSLLDSTEMKVFYRPETIETAEYISKTLGQTTVEYRTKGEGGKKGSLFLQNVNQSQQLASRPLMTPREVMELSNDECFVFSGGGKPIKAKKIKYYKDQNFLSMLKPPPITERAQVGAAVHSEWFSDRFCPVFNDDGEKSSNATCELNEESLSSALLEEKESEYSFESEVELI